MKRFLLFFGLLITSVTYAQNLSLSQLMTLRKMSLEDAEIFLHARGWSYVDGTAPADGDLGTVQFAYGEVGGFDYAEAFLTLIFSDDEPNRITIQISKQSKYTEYLNGVKTFSPTLINNTVKNGGLQKVYQGATTTFIFRTVTASDRFGDENAAWLLTIMDNYIYDVTFADQ